MAKTVYVIAGPNGAGKTTFARGILQQIAHCDEFVNADLIATGLSPFDPSSVAMRAGRLMLQRIQTLSRDKKTFSFETTLSGKAYMNWLKRLKKQQYEIRLFFLWIPSADLAVKRVQDRVLQGGHNVPETDIRRRYARGLHNFWSHYRALVDDWILFENSDNLPRAIVAGSRTTYNVLDEATWSEIRKAGL